MQAIANDLGEIESYYRTVAPFYAAEMRQRDDVAEWKALARRMAPRRVLDLGCGAGRVANALLESGLAGEVVGVDASRALLGDAEPSFTFLCADMRDLPLDEEFDLIVAANDPFANLLDDDDRRAALREARRLLARDGLLAIDGLYLPPQDDALASGRDGLIRERALDDGTAVRELWRSAGEHRYDTRYRYVREGTIVGDARIRVRAWHGADPALRECGAEIVGDLAERDFDPWARRLVAIIPGWS